MEPWEALAAAGHLHGRSGRFYGFCLGATLEGVAKLDGFMPEFFPQSGSFALLSEAFLSYKRGSLQGDIGRFMVDTPHIDGDDIRMFPNYFEGAYLRLGALRLYYLRKMAGWESGGEDMGFHEFPPIFGSHIDGVVAVGWERAKERLWFYGVDEAAWIAYGDLEWEEEDLCWGLQADFGQRSTLGEWSALVGGYLELLVDGASLYFALNKEFGQGAMPSFGGGPFYTSLELLTMDGFGARAVGAVAGLEAPFLLRSRIGAVGGCFDGERSDCELDVYLERESGKGVEVTLLGAFVKRGENLFRLIVKYGF